MKIKNKKKFRKSIMILTFILIMIICLIYTCIKFCMYPEKYLSTWKYQLKQDIEAGNQQAIEYYQKNYLERGEKLWD